MRQKSLEMEAENCRQLAKKFAGRPEEPFLFKLARALDEVAVMEKRQPPRRSASEPPHRRSLPSAPPRWLDRRLNG